MLLITFRKFVVQHYIRYLYSVLHTDRPSSAEYDILSAEEEMPEKPGARLYLMSGNMENHPEMIALPPGPRARGSIPPATSIAND
jgi:hypothetical protein